MHASRNNNKRKRIATKNSILKTDKRRKINIIKEKGKIDFRRNEKN